MHHMFMTFLNSFYHDYDLEYVSSFSKEFDQFFLKVSKDWDFIFSKTSKHLNWRFCENPENYSIILIKKDNNIVGYVVYRIISESLPSKLVIADFLFSRNHSAAFTIALSRIRKVAFENNLSIINTWCDINSLFAPVLLKNGFILKKEIPFINFKNSFSDSLNSIKNIHFTISDTDNI